jgi:hypothetical protein
VAVDRSFLAARQYGVKAFPVVFLIDPNGIIEAVHGRWSNTATNNGLDDLEADLRTELDLMLAGRTRADFPKKAPTAEYRAPAAKPGPARNGDAHALKPLCLNCGRTGARRAEARSFAQFTPEPGRVGRRAQHDDGWRRRIGLPARLALGECIRWCRLRFLPLCQSP